MEKYEELINQLGRYDDEIIQNEAIEKLSNLPIDKLEILLQPQGKNVWENAAIVIDHIISNTTNFNDEKIIFGLLEWLQDLNWPGAFIVTNILKKVDIHALIKCLEKAIDIAVKEFDECWIDYLNYAITRFEYLPKLDFKNPIYFEILTKKELEIEEIERFIKTLSKKECFR